MLRSNPLYCLSMFIIIIIQNPQTHKGHEAQTTEANEPPK